MNDNLNRFEGNQKNNQNNGHNNKRGNQQGGQSPKKQNLLVFLMATLISLVMMSYFMKSMDSSSKEIPYNEFVAMLEADKVESVYIGSDRIIIYPVKEENPQPQNLTMMMMQMQNEFTYYTGRAESNDTLTNRLLEAGVEIEPEIPESSNMLVDMLLSYVLPLVLVWVVFGFIMKRMGGGGGPMGVGKSNAKVYVKSSDGIKFDDVEEFVFLPTANNYQKPNLAPICDRITMLTFICKHLKNASVSDFEAKISEYKGTSYTLECFPGFYFVMGADNFDYIEKWINYP